MTKYIPDSAEDDDYLFQSRQGNSKPISRQQAYNILTDAACRAGITVKFSTHTLRKTFGYHSFKAGVSLPYLTKIFNHSSQSATLRYIGIKSEGDSREDSKA